MLDTIGSRSETADYKKSLDFEFVLFLLLYNVFVSIKGKRDTYTELLISLSLSALKVAEVFSEISLFGEGYCLIRSGNFFLSEDHKEQWNDVEMMIINIVDFLISNHISPQGFGSVNCKSENDKRLLLSAKHYNPF